MFLLQNHIIIACRFLVFAILEEIGNTWWFDHGQATVNLGRVVGCRMWKFSNWWYELNLRPKDRLSEIEVRWGNHKRKPHNNKSQKCTCYELLWLSRGNGKKHLSLFTIFPYRWILIWLEFWRWEFYISS